MKTLESLVGQKVKVYRNLRKNCYSVLVGVRVVAHLESLCLANVEFRVSEAGRQRVLREGQKNVHAYVVGILTENTGAEFKRKATYNPYRFSSFVASDTLEPLTIAEHVTLNPLGILYDPPFLP